MFTFRSRFFLTPETRNFQMKFLSKSVEIILKRVLNKFEREFTFGRRDRGFGGVCLSYCITDPQIRTITLDTRICRVNRL